MTDLIKKCILPAAGYGTRFLPITKSMPKEMLPIMDKPLVHYGVEEAYQASMRDITFIVGRNKEPIVNYFDINYELESEIRGTDKEEKLLSIRSLLDKCYFSYIRQGEMKGLGDAIKCARYHVERRAFAVLLSDDLCLTDTPENRVLTRMQEIYAQEKTYIIAVMEVDKKDVSSYGIVDASPISDNLFEVHNMIEKPSPKEAPSNLAIIGRYILMPSVFDYLDKVSTPKQKEIQITDALALAAKTERVLAYKIEAERFDCGTHSGFYDAFLYLLKQQGYLSG